MFLSFLIQKFSYEKNYFQMLKRLETSFIITIKQVLICLKDLFEKFLKVLLNIWKITYCVEKTLIVFLFFIKYFIGDYLKNTY